MKEYCTVSKKLDRTLSSSRNSCVQRLDKHQRNLIESYRLTDAFKQKHIEENASRKSVIDTANKRGVSRSTLIRSSAEDIEKKALSICKTGDDNQVAAARNRQFGVQLHVRLSNIPIATYNNKTEQYERVESGRFIIVGTWKKDYGEGNHFEGDYNQLPENDVELTPDKK